jgi:phosphatidylserine decarboxylase
MDPFSFLFWRFYYFFRDPERRIPLGKVVVAPADGLILYISRVESGSVPSPLKNGVKIELEEWFRDSSSQYFTQKSGFLVGIYMTPLSVHYNRSPVAGLIKSVIDRPAVHRNLSMSKALIRLMWGMKPYDKDSAFILKNARNIIMMEGEQPCAVIRIADSYVNQVDCYVRDGQMVEKGERIGMIRMGSQCDLFLPDTENLKIISTPGQKVYGGETIIASF